MAEDSNPVDEMAEARIQQLNLSYDKVQDRLLFRVGLSDDTEIALWLTYSFSRSLWTALNKGAHLPEAKAYTMAGSGEAVNAFRQEFEATEALKEMDFETEYAPREVLRNDGVMLAVSFELSEDFKRLDVTCFEGLVVNINLNDDLTLAICNMLQMACREAGWALSDVPPPIVIEDISESKTLH